MAVSTAADDDPDEWVRDAFLDPHLVAAVILGFGRRSRLGLETEGDEKPSTSATPAFLGWGRKRSRVGRLPRAATRTIGEEEDEGVTVTVEKRKGQRRASPQSPLEGYSSASGSGGGETPEGRRLTKAVGNPRTASVSSIPISASIRRPPSKKLTKPELQAVERSLLEEKAKLHKEMEELRRAVEELRANNRKLQMHLKSLNIPVRVCMALEDDQLPGLCQQCITLSPGHKDFIIIPDLNDPLPDC
ncbi:hypothetical protein MUK42_26547 [Musa troglodytarum]|uniref:Uncharacterized protein n=1 Tax=Musa troglodytarum TaxID=320322 RepID=A0A9E7GVN5_9LILI|nr:hypothetical protein MUK42_26547 [Musa troglodytarum]